MDEMNIKTPFLEQVARHYYEQKDQLIDYCFVFPNRRSGEFFLMNLARQQQGIPMLAPEITTITDFATMLTHSIMASPVEQIFTLYQAYIEITGNDQYSFDRFAFWGNVILNDFNDVDTSMVDAEQIFMNTQQLREIATDFLTPEVKEFFQQFFNVRFGETPTDEDQFWKHISHDEKSSVRNSFMRLWQVLYPLYTRFRERLSEQGLSYKGKIMRDAAQQIAGMAADDFRWKKYIFVGFNLLSACETTIFKRMKDKGIAEFCWDYDSPAFKQEENLATRFMKLNVKQFPSALPMPEPIEEFPEMTVVSVPFNVGQAKHAFRIVNQLVDSGDISDTNNAINTAIVLPDESLFVPLLNSAIGKVSRINVTLGYPLRNSSIASLMRIVAKMHRQATRTIDEHGDYVYTFYREDVKNVLSHPMVKSLFPRKVTELISVIDNNNLYRVPESIFNDCGFQQLFVTIRNTDDSTDVINYISRLEDFVTMVNEQVSEHSDPSSRSNEDDEPLPLQSAFLNKYLEVLEQVKVAISDYGVPMCESTVFFLIDKIAGIYSIPFEGEPLAGLQLMGVLETRCLDFANVIMLSMNERIFPRRFYTASFIPIQLRRHFNMPTVEHQESMMAYYFYRLISRANKVFMLYDSSAQAIGSGEHSRFITQLEKIYGCPIEHIQLTSSINPGNSLVINVKKQGRIADRIKDFLNPNSKRRLSASAIKSFIDCPLLFYFHYIEGLNNDNEESEFMDAATFGSIVHDTLQQLYYPAGKVNPDEPYKVTRQMILEFKKKHLDYHLVRNINRIYLDKKPEHLNDEITGEASILYEAFKIFVLNVINYDLELVKHDDEFFEIWECEQSHVTQIDLGDGICFNFKYKADRIDRINGTGPFRLIDYKTGNDVTRFYDFDSIYADKARNKRSIMQLFLYCNAYSQFLKEKKGIPEHVITPIIYTVKQMQETGIFHTNSQGRNKQCVLDFRGTYHDLPLNDEFLKSIKGLLSKLFDLDIPFSQCEEGNFPCNFCKFIEFCRRNKTERFEN